MLITGSFKSIDNQHTIKVDIYKNDPNNQTTYNVSDDKLDSTHHFCFKKDPVSIEHNWSDFFSPIITTTCKIKLISNMWCGDMLYATDYADIVCRVLRDNELVFIGYVEPRTYNQDINMQYNDIEIQAVDWLSVLSEYSYGNYVSFAQSATIKTFGNIISQINNRTFTFPNPTTGTTDTYQITTLIDSSLEIRYDTGTTTIDAETQIVTPVYATMPMYNIKISEVAFLGDSEDDAWTYADIFEGILKYCNARIVSSNGQNIFILSNDITGSYEDMYNLNSGSSTHIDLDNLLENEDIANEQVSLDDIYNQIGVNCNISDIDDVIDSPLEEDDLIDDTFTNKQLYMREYSSEAEGTKFDQLKYAEMQMYYYLRDNMNNRMNPNNFNNVSSEKLFYRDWYIRYLYNPNWKLNNNYALKDTNDRDAQAFVSLMGGYYNPATERYGYPFKVNETNVNQWCITMDLGYRPQVKHLSGDNRQANFNFPTPRTYTHNGSQYDWYYGAYFLAMGGSKKYTKTDHSKEGEVKMTNYLVLPVMGQHFGYFVNSNNNLGFSELERRLLRYEEKPMCKYESSNAMNLSPQKDNITNYIVFDGKIRLNPIWDGYYSPGGASSTKYYNEDIMRGYEYNVTRYGHDFEDWYDDVEDSHDEDDTVTAVGMWAYGEGDNPRHYYHRFVRQIYPTQSYGFSDWETNRNGSSVVLGGDKDMIEQLVPPIDNQHLQLCPYGQTWILNAQGSSLIQAQDYPIPVLCCQLKIGNKYLQENINTAENKMTYTWTTDSSARFSICIVPSFKNPLLNKEYSIVNTITDSMNLQCKGMAIPIRYNDNLNGKVEFTIYGPYNMGYIKDGDGGNVCVNQPNIWYQRPTASASWMPVMDRVQAIFISNFSCKVVSDNAKNSSKNDNDLMYLSVNNDNFKNDKTDIDFDIYTSIAAKEAFNVGVAAGVSYNNTLYGDNNRAITTEYADRPEVKYVQTLFDLYSDPKKIVEYDCKFNESLEELYRKKITSDVMDHLGLESINAIVTSSKLSLYNNRINIQLREV